MDKINILEKISFKPENFLQTIDFQGEKIIYKTYLPIDDKLKLATDVINIVINDARYANPGKLKVYGILYFIKYYTNIEIEELMNTDALNTYDKIITSNLYDAILQDDNIRHDWKEVRNIINTTLENIYKYNNSALGVIEAAASDYDKTSFDIDTMAKELSDPNNLSILKDVITKLG